MPDSNQQIAATVDADASVLYLWHVPSDRLRFSQSSSPSEGAELASALADRTFLSGRPVVVSPGAPDDTLGQAGLPPGMVPAIAVPLHAADHA